MWGDSKPHADPLPVESAGWVVLGDLQGTNPRRPRDGSWDGESSQYSNYFKVGWRAQLHRQWVGVKFLEYFKKQWLNWNVKNDIENVLKM